MGNFGEPAAANNAFAWQNGLPCLNPSCKSHGRPHPNCRCYSGGEFAEGGQADYFCSTTRPHKSDCEYFQDGGKVVDFDSMKDHSTDQTKQTPVSFDDMQDHSFDNMQDHTSDKYNTTGQTIGAGAEAIARGAIGPLAPALELGASALGVPNMTAEDIAGREAAHPASSTALEYGTLAATTALSGGLRGTLGGVLAAGEHAVPLLLEKYGMAPLSKAGSYFIKNATYGLIKHESDEVTKGLLGQSDPSATVSSAMADGVLASFLSGTGGLAAHGLGEIGSSFLGKVGNIQAGTALDNFVKGVGRANQLSQGVVSEIPKEIESKAFNIGMKTHDIAKKLIGATSAAGGAAYGIYKGYEEDGVTGAIKDGILGALKGYTGAAAVKYVVPGVIRIITDSEGKVLPNLTSGLRYLKKVGDGAQKTDGLVNSIFKPVAATAIDNTEKFKKIVQDVKDNIRNGGVDQNIQQQQIEDNQPQSTELPGFAEGGVVEHETLEQLESHRRKLHRDFNHAMNSGKHDEADKIDDQIEHVRNKVKKLHSLKKVTHSKSDSLTPMQKGGVAPLLHDNDSLTTYFPEHNSMLNAAHLRVSNYLTQQQPQQHPKMLPFDNKPNQSMQEKSYDKVVHMAVNPLGILHKLKVGRLTKEDMVHFTAMYPELHNHLKNKLTERIVQAQMSGEKPSSKIRQSMSLFLGAPLDSSMTQPMMAAAQAVFAPKQPPQQQGTKKGTSALKKTSEEYQTPADAAAKRASDNK